METYLIVAICVAAYLLQGFIVWLVGYSASHSKDLDFELKLGSIIGTLALWPAIIVMMLIDVFYKIW